MKNKSEIILDNNYCLIMRSIEEILELVDLDKNIIKNKLDDNEISQTDLDYELLGLIDAIIEKECE